MAGNVIPLYFDSLDRPKAYTDETRVLLERLVCTRGTPTEEEMRLLDAAVLDFSSETQTPPRPPTRVAPAVANKPAASSVDNPFGTDLPPYWWI